jgi:hypothetical protein
MLKNPVYYGLIRYKGELYEGKHEPIITKALFDKCQEVMLRKSKPKGPRLKPYTYRGVFHCATCGCFITTETQKAHNYLRCTKRKGPCDEPFVREEVIEEEIKGELKSVSLPPADRFEPEIELYREAVHVGELAERGKAEENREKLKKIGSNFRIGRRRLSVEYKKP